VDGMYYFSKTNKAIRQVYQDGTSVIYSIKDQKEIALDAYVSVYVYECE
jgi:hypothetical protein